MEAGTEETMGTIGGDFSSAENVCLGDKENVGGYDDKGGVVTVTTVVVDPMSTLDNVLDKTEGIIRNNSSAEGGDADDVLMRF